jgi:hypothetical protein
VKRSSVASLSSWLGRSASGTLGFRLAVVNDDTRVALCSDIDRPGHNRQSIRISGWKVGRAGVNSLPGEDTEA